MTKSGYEEKTMNRSVGESPSSSNRTDTKIPFVKSLLVVFKQVIGFFDMTEDELSQAGICLRPYDKRDLDNQMNPHHFQHKQILFFFHLA